MMRRLTKPVWEQYRKLLHEYYDGHAAKAHVEYIANFYRSPGSTGYNAALDYAAQVLSDAGVQYEIDSFPLGAGGTVMDVPTARGWEPESATLELTAPSTRQLLSWETTPTCVPWWCPPTPPGGVELDVVDVGTGLADEDFSRQDVTGKAVLVHDSGTSESPISIEWHTIVERAVRFGARAILTNNLLYQFSPWRTRESVPGAVQQLRLPAFATDNPWTLTVSDITLRELVDLGSKARVRISIRSRSFETESRYIVAQIPGTDPAAPAIGLVSHLSAAAKPGANCASGAALLLELSSVMSRLLVEGRLEQPRGSLYFLFGQEWLSAQHWLETSQHPSELFTSMAFCSPGLDQAESRGSLVFAKSPVSRPAALDDLVAGLIESAYREGDRAYRARQEEIDAVNVNILPYTPWSDNAVLAKLGVPSGLFMSLPDRNFHTQYLSADKVDPAVFRRCAEVAGSAAFTFAEAEPEALRALVLEVGRRRRAEIERLNIGVASGDGPRQGSDVPYADAALGHALESGQEALRSLQRLIGADESEQYDALADLIEEEEQTLTAASRRFLQTVNTGRGEDDHDARCRCSHARPVRASVMLPMEYAGIPYDIVSDLVRRMADIEPRVANATLTIIIDEIWGLSSGTRCVGQITRTISSGMELALHEDHISEVVALLVERGFLSVDA